MYSLFVIGLQILSKPIIKYIISYVTGQSQSNRTYIQNDLLGSLDLSDLFFFIDL